MVLRLPAFSICWRQYRAQRIRDDSLRLTGPATIPVVPSLGLARQNLPYIQVLDEHRE